MDSRFELGLHNSSPVLSPFSFILFFLRSTLFQKQQSKIGARACCTFAHYNSISIHLHASWVGMLQISLAVLAQVHAVNAGSIFLACSEEQRKDGARTGLAGQRCACNVCNRLEYCIVMIRNIYCQHASTQLTLG